MKKAIWIISFFLVGSVVSSHPWKPGHFVIIDTDGGADDMRTICMMLASPDIRVLGITVSPGELPAPEVYVRTSSLLYGLHHEGIPVGINYTRVIKPRDSRSTADASWGDEKPVNPPSLTALSMMTYLMLHSGEKFTLVNLGTLNTLALYADSLPDLFKKTQRILWANDDCLPSKGMNYTRDPGSYKKLQKKGIAFETVTGEYPSWNDFNQAIPGKLSSVNTAYAVPFSRSLDMTSQCGTGWFGELTAVYLHHPDLFETVTVRGLKKHTLLAEAGTERLAEAFRNILAGETVPMNQVLASFSLEKTDYYEDVQPMMTKTLTLHGKQEWVAGVMTNEMHRHLGVYSIIGVKMGIRAMEYFGAGVDELKVVSYAGMVPPFSCLNDGLQVSTGATLGHGLIQVPETNHPRPEAEFTYLGKTIHLSLKAATALEIASAIRELESIHGINSNIYWELVRRLALQYWQSLDRHDVFSIKVQD